MSTTRQVTEIIVRSGDAGLKGAVLGATSAAFLSDFNKKRAIELCVMLGIGKFILHCLTAKIDAESLCISLRITKHPYVFVTFMRRLFSGGTSDFNVNAIENEVQDLIVPRIHGARSTIKNLVAVLQFIPFLTENAVAALLGYMLFSSRAAYGKDLSHSLKQTLFAASLAAGFEAGLEKVANTLTREVKDLQRKYFLTP